MLKVCRLYDQEPHLFKQMEESAVYPRVYSINKCMEYDSVAQPVYRWYAWVCEMQSRWISVSLKMVLQTMSSGDALLGLFVLCFVQLREGIISATMACTTLA